jgi:TonB family protein
LKLSTDQLSVTGQSGNRSEAAGIYGAPEAARGAFSPAADVWSLGVTLVEALTQHIPIADESGQTDPRVPDSIPEPFAGIARECLRRDPARRCSLSDIKARLAGQRPLPVVAEITRPGDKAPSKLRTPALIATVIVAVALVAFLFLRSHHTEPSAPTAQNPAPAPAPPPLPAQAPIAEKPTAGDATVKGAVAEGEVVERVQPEVLPAATESIHGHVDLGIRVAVDPNGNVSEARLERAGPSRYFAKVALEAARKWRFKPAQIGGRPVASVWILKFEFTQAGTEITPVETSP